MRRRVIGPLRDPQGLSIMLVLFAIGILFVLFRMKNVELNYKMSELNEKIEERELRDKELKAEKARMLSVKNLKAMAKKYNLGEPKQQQIIVIP